MRFGWFAIGILCFVAQGQPLVPGPAGNATASTAAPKPGLRSRNERYRLQPSDIIAVAFRFTPEFNQTLTVQPDGFAVAGGFNPGARDSQVPSPSCSPNLWT
ncbi:MAG TPA: hypothetical protein VGV35_10440 [Bryobacteraceae bacterium]|nr:hypothetical protein [Bryobacteraceae bacterium]